MISIITPTYNRASTLHKLYNSLCRQSVKNFEWIIIDDGSLDETEKIVQQWISDESDFEIYYYKQLNSGKHIAVNNGVEHAKFDFCMIVDSDDFLSNDAMSLINSWITEIESNDNFAGVAGLKAYSDGKPIGLFIPKHEYVDATNIERTRVGLTGDKAEIYRTHLLKENPFPNFENENFLTEEVVWDTIANKGYKIRWYNKTICYCEYMSDGLTLKGDKKFLDNFVGYTYATRQKIKLHGYITGLSATANYYIIAKQKGLGVSNICSNIEVSIIKLSISVCFYYLKKIAKYIRDNWVRN